jgi:hypothetical protein
MSTNPKPFLPSDLRNNTRRARSIVRGITALARHNMLRDAAAFAERAWPGDKQAVEIAQKAAVTPLMTTTTGAPVHTSVSDLIDILDGASAAAQLFALSMQLSFGSDVAILVPGMTASATGIAFAAQGAPIQARQLSLAGPTLTQEQIESSNAEAFITAALKENISLALDVLLFDTTAADATRPQGLRNGVSGLTATSGGGLAALTGDLAQLADAVSAVGGANVAYVCNVKDWVKIRTLAPLLSLPVLPTNGLAAGTILCCAPDGLAVAGSDDPIRIERSTETVVHMETSPLPFSSVGTPNTIAAPLLSAFQVNVTVVKLVAEITWALRVTSGAVSWLSSLTW